MGSLQNVCRDLQDGINIQEKKWAGRRRAEILEKENEKGDGRRNEYEKKGRERKRKEKGRGQLNN